MGDVIHTFPAVTDALAAVEELAIDWLVEAPFAPLVALHPGIGTAIPVAMRRWRRRPLDAATRSAVGDLRRRLKAAGYDRVLDAQGLMKSALLARLAGAPVAGFDRASAREGWIAPLYAERHAVPRRLHAIARTRLLFGQALGYRPDLDTVRYGLAAPRMPASGNGDRAFLLHGTTWQSKKWPDAAWARTARGLAERGLTPVTTYADDAERATAAAIAAAVPETVVLPKTDLAVLAGHIAGARLAIGVDTGLTHLATALDVPTVALFLATRPGLTGPVGRRCATLSALPDDAGLAPVSRRAAVPAGRTITPEQVLETAEDLIAGD